MPLIPCIQSCCCCFVCPHFGFISFLYLYFGFDRLLVVVCFGSLLLASFFDSLILCFCRMPAIPCFQSCCCCFCFVCPDFCLSSFPSWIFYFGFDWWFVVVCFFGSLLLVSFFLFFAFATCPWFHASHPDADAACVPTSASFPSCIFTSDSTGGWLLLASACYFWLVSCLTLWYIAFAANALKSMIPILRLLLLLLRVSPTSACLHFLLASLLRIQPVVGCCLLRLVAFG